MNKRRMTKMPRPFFCCDELCKGCKRIYSLVDAGGREKGFCFGITNPESKKANNIPPSDRFRFCLKHLPLKKLPVKHLFQLNMEEIEVKELIKGFDKLLRQNKCEVKD